MRLFSCFSGRCALLALLSLAVCGAATSPVQAAAVLLTNAWAPSVAPDGRQMVFVRRTPQGNRLFVSSLNGKHPRAIGRPKDGRGDDVDPNWRADGHSIVFASNRGGNFDLYTIHPDGTHLTQITHTRTDERDPQWSPRAFGFGPDGTSVPQRSLRTIGKSDLQLLKELAGGADRVEDYGDTKFDIKPLQSFYKLLCTAGNGGGQNVVTMCEDGTLRFALSTGMAGAHHHPRWERTGTVFAFARKVGGQEFLYMADAPILEDDIATGSKQLLRIGSKKYWIGLDIQRWRESIKRRATIPIGSGLNWTKNGEYFAIAAKRQLRLIPRDDVEASATREVRMALPTSSAAQSIAWADAHTSLLTVRGAKGQSNILPFYVREPLLDVINWLDFATDDRTEAPLELVDRAYLASQSMAATGEGSPQMYSIYEETDYEDLPIFVTSDSLLHLHHLLFDYLYRTVESEHLMPAVIALNLHYLNASLRQAKYTSNPAVKDAALANAAFFAVAARLALGEVKTGLATNVPNPSEREDELEQEHRQAIAAAQNRRQVRLNNWTAPLAKVLETLPASARSTADAEIALISAHRALQESPLFGGYLTSQRKIEAGALVTDTRINYSDFVPRGHYTRTEILRRYFLLSRWLAAAPFRPSAHGLQQSLLLVAATDKHTYAQLQKILRVLDEFIGNTDELDLPHYVQVASKVFNHQPQLSDLNDKTKVDNFRKVVQRLPGPRIAGVQELKMHLMPQPYTLDDAIMQNMVYDNRPPDVGARQKPRFFALGLDLMSILGSERARSILDATKFQGSFFDQNWRETQYANYDTQFRAERAKIARMTQADWQRNLYTRTLHALLPLLQPQGQREYHFTQSKAWKDKQLNCALAAWTELKHDTMPKQAVAIETGGEGGLSEAVLLEQPQGFVEPSPVVYKRLSQLVATERQVLAQAGYLTPDLRQRISTLAALLAMVSRLEAKQRKGQSLTKGEIEQLRFYGVFLEHLTLTTEDGQSESLEYKDMAIITDVASAYSTTLRKQIVLEEAVGHALPIYVAVERGGQRTLARGAIYTYYEFTYPANDRLTDRKWQQYLALPDRPRKPSWTKSFVSRHLESATG